MNTAEDLRTAFTARYPDVEDNDFSLEHSGFGHEHPLTAIAVVLLSAVVLGTTDVNKLVEFTKYSARFVGAIALNMENSGLWQDGKYHSSTWSSHSVLPINENEDACFWDHILIAEGSQWAADAKTDSGLDSSMIFWNEKKVN
jgi:hypothetical protein